MTQVFLITNGPPGTNFTLTSDATWNNASNTVECIGAGASGGSAQRTGNSATGGGGGAYSLISNFTFATPGTTPYTARIGLGGAKVTPTAGATVNTNGNDGGATWFNNATDPGNGADNSKCSAAGGVKGVGGVVPQNGGAGGATTASWGTTKNAGGRGGNHTGTNGAGTGGGGAGGNTAAGSQGADTALSNVGTAGGEGGATNGGAAGTTPSGAGGAGTNFDATHGAGGGGGGLRAAANSAQTSGSGGNYGGAGSGCANQGSGGGGSTQAISGAGSNGIIVLTWTPAGGAANPFIQDDWPLTSAPRQPENLKSWTWQYNANLISKDQLPVGEISTALPVKAYEYHVQLPNWTWSYNLNLIGVVPPVVPPFNQKDWPVPKGYEFSLTLRSWSVSPKPVPVIVESAIFRAPHFTPSRAPAQPISILTVNPLTLRIAAVQIPFNQKDWSNARGYEHNVQLRSWAWNYNLNLVGNDFVPGRIIIDRPPLAPTLLQTWISSVNLALTTTTTRPFAQYDWPLIPASVRSADLSTWTSQVKLLLLVPFKQHDWLNPRAPQQPAYSWTASYNLNLIGQDKLPTGETITDLPPQPAISAIQLRTWINSTSFALLGGTPVKPFAQYDWPLNFGPQQPVQIFSATYNKNLVGKDQLPTGEIVSDLPPQPAQPPLPVLVASYNPNLIGKDRLPVGVEITDLPPQPALSAIQLRTWINTVALALVTAPPVKPFNQQDWPLNTGPRQPVQIFTASYNQNLIGKDQLPSGEIVTDLPPRAPQQPTTIFTASDNKNLIGKDQLPTGVEITGLPPQPALSAIQLRTWIQTVNLALVTTPPVRPFAQYDWPLNTGPRQPIHVFTASYNRNLTGQDQLPAGEIITALPTQQRLAAQTWINAVNLALTSVQVTPFNQIDWQRPIAAVPFNRSFAAFYNPNLIGKDRLPFRQQDWPLYRPFLQPAYGYTASYNRNLIGKDRLPFRQMYWPVPPEFRRLSDWIVRTNPNLFVPPIPPPEILPRDPTHLRTRSGFELDARGQPSLDQRGAGIDARGPSSVDRRGSDRFNRGRNES